MDDFPLTVLLTEDDGITEGYLRAIWHPEQRAAVDHLADAALAVGLKSARHDLHLTHLLRLSPHRLTEGRKALPPFVRVGADKHHSLLA